MRYNPKTESLFNRDGSFKVIVGDYRRSEFALVNSWVCSQKLDGTSGILHFELFDVDGEKVLNYTIHGRTAKAQYNPDVLNQLHNIAVGSFHKVGESMINHDLTTMNFYGEVYGPRVQSGGRYRDDIGFAVFDIIVNDKVFLNPGSITEVCERVGLDTVPLLGVMSTEEIVELVRGGQQSVLTNGQDFIAEGVVAKSPFFDNVGRQVKFKLKASDF